MSDDEDNKATCSNNKASQSFTSCKLTSDSIIQYNAPSSLSFNSSIETNWSKWKQKFQIFMKASGKNDIDDEDTKIAIFLNFIGDEGIDVYNNLNISTTDLTLEQVLQAFDEYCSPQKNETVETFKFNHITQTEEQSFNNFVTDLKKQAKLCNFNCEHCGKSYENR